MDDDATLLKVFIACRDEAAFSAIVVRHSPLVLGACRRVLGGGGDAEDAAQAAFLILAHEAGRLDRDRPLAPWLHRVAVNAARDLERERRARRRREQEAASMVPTSTSESAGHALVDQLDDCLAQLPRAERDVLVLVHLQGLSSQETARRLGRSEGTIASWLHRGRERLRDLLRRRGFAVPTTVVVAALTSLTAAELPAGFASTTSTLAISFTAAQSTSTPAAALATQGIHTMRTTQVLHRTMAAATLLVAVSVTGWLITAAEPASNPPPVATPPVEITQPRDRSLPAGAIVRLGDYRFRTTDVGNKIALSSDGAWLAAGGGRPQVHVWNLATGDEHILQGHTSSIECLRFSPDGRTLATGSLDKSIRLWDLATYTASHVLQGHGGQITGIVFSNDGSQVVSCSNDDRSLRFWDTKTGTLKQRLPLEWEVGAIALSPDGRQLALFVDPETVCVIDMITHTGLLPNPRVPGEQHHWTFPSGRIVFSPDGQRVITGGSESFFRRKKDDIVVWDATSCRPLSTLTIAEPATQSMALSDDGQWLAVGAYSQTIRVIPATASNHRKEFTLNTGSAGGTWGLAFSHDGKLLYAGGPSNAIQCFDLLTGKNIFARHGHPGFICDATYMPDGSRVATAGHDGTVRMWDPITGQEVSVLQAHTGFATSVAVTKDGKQLASAGWNDEARLWDIASSKLLRQFPQSRGPVLFAHADAMLVTFMDAAVDADEQIGVWSTETGVLARTCTNPLKKSFATMILDSKHQILFTGENETLEAATSGTVSVDPDGEPVTVTATATFGPDTILPKKDSPIRAWDLATGRELFALHGHTFTVHYLALSADGKRLLSAGADDTVRLWDLESRAEILKITGDGPVAFVPNTNLFLACKHEEGRSSLVVHALADGKALNQRSGHRAQIYSLAFSPDQKQVVTTSWDSTALVWSVSDLVNNLQRP